MTQTFRIRLIVAALVVFAVSALQAQTLTPSYERVEEELRPITVEDMYKFGRVADPQPSPNGESVLYTVTWYDMEANKSNTDIYKVPVKGGESLRLTTDGGYDGMPRWSPDGNTIAFISSRMDGAQIWLMNPDGGDKRGLTAMPTGVDNIAWVPTGDRLLFTSNVHPECESMDCQKKMEEKLAEDPKAMIADDLPYRVWNHWKDGKFSHVFSVPLDGGTPEDLTPGRYDTPPIDLGGNQDFTASPDGKELAYVRNTDENIAWSTNNDIWIRDFAGSHDECITKDNKANDNNPVYSPDGRYIAYRSMSRPGYEADKYDLKVYDRESKRTWILTTDFDRSVDEIIWRPDGKNILFTAWDEAYISLFEVAAEGGDIFRVLKGIVTLRYEEQGEEKTLDMGTTRRDFSILRDNETLVFTGQRMNYPTEILTAKYQGNAVRDLQQLTATNYELWKQLDMNPAQSFTFKSFDGVDVQGWIVPPPDFDPMKKYPMIYLVHGGPQGVWGDLFHYRWNAELFASPGYVVVMVNCRGSISFGQNFTDGVNQSWGGAPYKDLMTGLDYVLQSFPFIDSTRIGAAGASYGGYMMNWFLGHTNRFKAILSHAGVYDLVSMYGATEELWFPEWEFGGTPWTNPEQYEKWSPSNFVENFSTPTYVSHGQKDFRVPVTQSMQLFTALQRRGVESKFLYFPDEGHLILKPKNAKLWYDEFHAWFEKHLKK